MAGDVAALDLAIGAALIEVRVARELAARSPNGESARRLEAAVTEMDRLLDLRLLRTAR